jgi:hypothetical protein
LEPPRHKGRPRYHVRDASHQSRSQLGFIL